MGVLCAGVRDREREREWGGREESTAGQEVGGGVESRWIAGVVE